MNIYKKSIPLAFISTLLLICIVTTTANPEILASEHDVAIIGVTISDTEAYPTWVVPLNINVTVKNNGTSTESFNVTVYYDGTTIDNKTVANLAPGENITLMFAWDIPDIPFAYPYPTYTISANASAVTNETDTTNNFLADGTVKIKWPADTNGDGHISVFDLYLFARSWYRKRGHPKYDQRTDFNNNGEVNVHDLYLLAKSWYKGPLD